MKNHNVLVSMLIVACVTGLSSCFGPGPSPQKLRIKTFEWDNILYRAQYDPYGTLTKLQGTDRNIDFYYDENYKLSEVTITRHGEATPDLTYTFSYGVWGITEIHTLSAGSSEPGTVRFSYLTPTKLSSMTEYIGWDLERRFTYSGNNVARVYVIPPFTEYTASVYDDKSNPFMILADAVNHPPFFPIGLFANFPVVDYDIPLISVFSQNNPVHAVYQIEGAPITKTTQVFKYTYAGNLVKKIVWYSTYLTSPTETRTFKFDYEWARCLPHEHHAAK